MRLIIHTVTRGAGLHEQCGLSDATGRWLLQSEDCKSSERGFFFRNCGAMNVYFRHRRARLEFKCIMLCCKLSMSCEWAGHANVSGSYAGYNPKSWGLPVNGTCVVFPKGDHCPIQGWTWLLNCMYASLFFSYIHLKSVDIKQLKPLTEGGRSLLVVPLQTQTHGNRSSIQHSFGNVSIQAICM